MYHFGFIVEQALGHTTHGQNLQRNVADDPSVKASWGLPSWEADGLAGHIGNWTVKAGLQARRATAEMQREAPLDALFFHTQITAVLSQDWIRRVPSIISLDATPKQYDSLGEFYEHDAGPSWLEGIKWRLNRDAFKHARHLVTWSQWAKDGLSAEYDVDPDKVSVIAPGVNPDEWAVPAPRSQDGPIKILFVGGNLARKGGHDLLEAFGKLRRDLLQAEEAYPAVELHLVTRDSVPPTPGVFVYNNMTPNSAPLRQLFHDCHIFALPTYGDCLPMVLAEAGAAGLPIVSTNVAAIPELVHDGETGLLIKPGDVDGLYTMLWHFIEYPEWRTEFGERAEALVRRDHDARKNAARLVALLKQVAEQEGVLELA